GRAGAFPGHRCPEFPGGSHRLHAPAGGGRGEAPGLRRRRAIRRCGAHRRPGDDPGGGAAGARPAVSAGLCRRGHALCGGGGDDSGDVPGTPLPHRCAGLCCGLQRDDGAGRGPGMTVRTISVRCP
ncbi:Desulfoferrodoxin, partial [Dysosmobacter welbionis]